MVARGRTWALAGSLLVLFLLAACNTADNTAGTDTTGEQTRFEVSGDVSAVDVEDVDLDPNISAGPDGIDINPEASVRVQLTINIESVNDEAAELCNLEAGSDAIVVVTDDTELNLDRSITELDTLSDESIVATGVAQERQAESGASPTATDPDGGCLLTAQSLELDQESATSSPSPAP
ncbi:MAG TPA: hypothetical protein VHI31_01950 [Actinomycetota bacterium]|nr:hypothetical protein [Actinomycetota bacterium]